MTNFQERNQPTIQHSGSSIFLILPLGSIRRSRKINWSDMIEHQEPFNFDSSAPKLKISTTVMTMATTPMEKLKIKHEHDTGSNMKHNYKCISSEKVIIISIWGKHMHSYLGNAQQA